MQGYHTVEVESHKFSVSNRLQGWIPGKLVHSGSLGKILQLNHPDGVQSVCLKKISDVDRLQRAKFALRELNLLRTLKHENIVKLIGAYKAEDEATDRLSIYHVTLYCGVPLSEKIKEGKYTLDRARLWIRQLLLAVQCLHSSKVIHRNLHPGNMCVDANGKLTLIGFGRARVMDVEMTQQAGTTPYEAFESLIPLTSGYDEKVDIWSASVILCQLVSGRLLLGERLKTQLEYYGRVENYQLDKIKMPADRIYLEKAMTEIEAAKGPLTRKNFVPILCTAHDPLLPKRKIRDADIIGCSTILEDFLQHTLQFDPDRRPTAQQALIHPLLLTVQPWEEQLPQDDAQALDQLNRRIDEEIAAAPY